MPIYEKMISPLCVRFTQEHIKTIFRDQRIVDETVEEITASPGEGDYDLVLEAPFPTIEIIRFCDPLLRGESEAHWFTLDNRRLYCLQRAAAKFWPRKVACKVHLLSAEPGSVRRKYDTTTDGRSVTISHSCKEAPIAVWNWCEAVNLRPTPPELRALEVLNIDDEKDVDDLLDVPGNGSDSNSILARAMAGVDGATQAKRERALIRTPSTAASDEDSDRQSDASSSSCPSGTRSGGVGVSIAASVTKVQPDVFLPEQPWGHYAYHPHQDMSMGGCPCPWTATESWSDAWIADAAATEGCPCPWTANESWSDAWIADAAATEIEASLAAQGGVGVAWIKDWNERYLGNLGQMRMFVESRPDRFRVLPNANGRGFRIASTRIFGR